MAMSAAVITAADVGSVTDTLRRPRVAASGQLNREETGRAGERETAEIGYWATVAARGRANRSDSGRRRYSA